MSSWSNVISNIKLDSDKIIADKVKYKDNRFNIVCPCGEYADVMSYRKTNKNELMVTYICPSCGSVGKEIHFLYE